MNILRECFVDTLCSVDHERCVHSTYFDFEKIFVFVLNKQNRLYTYECNSIICDSSDEENEILDGLIFRSRFHSVHRHLFMSFLSFVVNKNTYLAQIVFRYRRLLQTIMFDKYLSEDDFNTVLQWDRTTQANIFKDERGSYMLQLCNRVFISKLETDRMRKIIAEYGSTLLEWVPTGGFYRQTCVNSFIFAGCMLRKQWQNSPIEEEVDYALDFLIAACPAALRICTTSDTGKRIDGFSQVLHMSQSGNETKDSQLVEKVYRHITTEDIHEISYTADNKTLLDLIILSRNRLVARHLEKTQKIEIIFPPLW